LLAVEKVHGYTTYFGITVAVDRFDFVIALVNINGVTRHLKAG
jgi:hypothetical protein